MPETKASDRRIKRIIRDISDLVKNPLHDSGIYITHDESDISKAYALIFGPEDTPYEHGAYFFTFKFPQNYPFEPPVTKFVTYAPGGKTRFHPNLYVDGKVCLSILNTWNGPSWTSVQTLSSVLLSIRSILDEKPLENEPGFENTTVAKNEGFNNCIRYQNLNVAILHQLDKIPNGFDEFQPILEEHFVKNFVKIRERAVEYESKYQNKNFECTTYSMYFTTDYTSLISNLDQKYKKLKGKFEPVPQPEAQPAPLVEETPHRPKKKLVKIIKKTQVA